MAVNVLTFVMCSKAFITLRVACVKCVFTGGDRCVMSVTGECCTCVATLVLYG